MKYFVLVYDKRAGALLGEAVFDEAQHQDALDERRSLMLKYRLDPNIEVALLGSESREDLMKTHERYFEKTPAEFAAGR